MTAEKNGIIRYFPDFVDCNEEDLKQLEFNTLEELMELPWVKRFSKKVEDPLIFLKYSIAPGVGFGAFINYTREINNYYGLLMAEYLDQQSKEKQWRTVSYLKFDIKELPRFSRELDN